MSAVKKRIRNIEALGWSVERTNGNHLRCTHPDASHPVFTGSTPSDWRNWQRLLTDMRRALKPKPAPVA